MEQVRLIDCYCAGSRDHNYTKEEGMQLNGNNLDGEILSITKNKYAFTKYPEEYGR